MLKRLGFIGMGPIARAHAEAARILGADVVLAAGAHHGSPNWPAFQEIAPGCKLATAEEVKLARFLDGIVVAAAWHAMPQLALLLADSDLPMLFEKPVGLAAADLGWLSHQNLVIHNKTVGFNRRFYEPVQMLKQRIGRGGLIHADVTISEHLALHVERTGREVIPHLLAFTSIHTFDLMLHLFGHLEVVDVLKVQRPAHPEFPHLNGLLKAVHHAPARAVTLHVNRDEPSRPGIRCSFDDGTFWELSPLEVLRVYSGVRMVEDGLARRYLPVLDWQLACDGPCKPGFLEQMHAFLNQEDTAATLVDAKSALELAEAVAA